MDIPCLTFCVSSGNGRVPSGILFGTSTISYNLRTADTASAILFVSRKTLDNFDENEAVVAVIRFNVANDTAIEAGCCTARRANTTCFLPMSTEKSSHTENLNSRVVCPPKKN